jgi:hypothetical protein
VSAGDGAAEPPVDRRLELAWRRHRQWSLAARAARARLDRWRRSNLALLVLGALAGAVAAQPELPTGVATAFAVVAAVVLAVAGLIQTTALTKDQTSRWTKARAASEALKAEVHRYLVGVAPYDGADRGDVLESRRVEVQRRTADLLVDQQSTESDARSLPAVRDIGAYVRDRAQKQADWHRRRTGKHVRQARGLRIGQITATGAGVVLSAVAGFAPAWHLTTWTAALATVAAAFGTQLAATQHQRIAAGYAATADQLEGLVAGFDPDSDPARQAQFVAEVERVLANQNDGWTDLLTTDRTVQQHGDPARAGRPPVSDPLEGGRGTTGSTAPH